MVPSINPALDCSINPDGNSIPAGWMAESWREFKKSSDVSPEWQQGVEEGKKC